MFFSALRFVKTKCFHIGQYSEYIGLSDSNKIYRTSTDIHSDAA